MAAVRTRTNRDRQDVGGSCGVAQRNAHIPDRVGIPGAALPSFDGLSSEAKLLFVIGEPLRRSRELNFQDWINRTAALWIGATEKSVDDFRLAFKELSIWVNKPR